MADERQAAHKVALAIDSPAADAARTLLKPRMRAVIRLVERSAREPSARRVHRLRVATRRASAAVEAFTPWLDARASLRLARRLRRLRRAAGRVRQHDVYLDMLNQLVTVAPEEQSSLARRLIRWTHRERDRAMAALERTLERRGAGLRSLTRRAISGADDIQGAGATYFDAAQPVFEAVRAEVAAARKGDLGELADLHALRLALKHFRYAAELFGPCLGTRLERIMPSLGRAQEVLGAVNDSGEMVHHLERLAAGASRKSPTGQTVTAIRTLVNRYAAVRDRRHRDALAWWEGFVQGGAMETLEESLPGSGGRVPGATPARADGQATFPLIPSPAPGSLFPSRFAAIDVGTNSIRLIVAEAAVDGSYRVLDEEREVVRLGQGMAYTGRMSESAMTRAAGAIARMRAIADGFGVAVLRVVGTSAAREARNADRLVTLVRDAAGVDLEVISADAEARMAFLSVSRAFDIGSGPVAVVDIGGGSTEVILSAAGVMEKVYALRLGALRLADRFGGPRAAAGDGYRGLRAFVRSEIEDVVGRPPLVPQLIIGTGGTFASAASMDRARLGSAAPPSVQGYGLRRADIRHLLDRLRRAPTRAGFPGLAPDRADIIVPGLAIIDGLLRHLGVNDVVVHERGIRDGLLLTMIREHLPGVRPAAGACPDPLASARRFARVCRYEEAHAEHVARLALSIFDQLASAVPAPWATPEARLVLECAAVLHDIGYLINYAHHHKHSYHLIMHADLEGLTARQVALVAGVARYHRRAEPALRHESFRRLTRADRGLVIGLSAILRTADGLDRAHNQAVRGVMVRVDRRRGIADLVVDAPDSLAPGLRAGEGGGSLFRRAFGLEARTRRAGAKKAPAEPAGAPEKAVDDRPTQQPASKAFR